MASFTATDVPSSSPSPPELPHPLNSPIYITPTLSLPYPILAVAPMVGQCDPAFRLLTERYSANLIYTEMYLAKEFVADEVYRSDALGTTPPFTTAPILVQFAANDPASFAKACLLTRELGYWGADLNLGCPQLRAKEGHYGSYLQEDVDLCCEILKAGVASAGADGHFAVTVKIRMQSTIEKTILYATRLKDAGAVLICLHGRQRGSVNARRDGSADMEGIAAVVAALAPFPVVSNGNVRAPEDCVENLKYTGACGVAVAEEILRNPGVFDDVRTLLEGRPVKHEETVRWRRLLLLTEYLDICKELETCGVPRDDFSEWPKGGKHGGGGGMVRAATRTAGAGKMRYSNWWSHAEVVKQHTRRILDVVGHKDLCQRSTFRKMRWLAELDKFIRRRLRLPGQEEEKEEIVDVFEDGDESLFNILEP